MATGIQQNFQFDLSLPPSMLSLPIRKKYELVGPKGQKISSSTWLTGPTEIIRHEKNHREKAQAVVAHGDSPDEKPTMILSDGNDYTEDLLEIAEKVREENRANKSSIEQEKKEDIKRFRDGMAREFQREIDYRKAHAVTARPDRNHEKRVW